MIIHTYFNIIFVAGVRYGLLVNKEYFVGRKDGDIVVPADQSMSRKHAKLSVHHSEAHIVRKQQKNKFTQFVSYPQF